MEKSRMITRSMYQRLSGEKASSGFKRKNECLFSQGLDCFGPAKRKRMPKDGSVYFAVKDLRSRRIFSPSGLKSTDGSPQAHPEKGKQMEFVSSASGAAEGFQIVLAVPLSQCDSVDPVRTNADVPCLESQDQNVAGRVVGSEAERLEIENEDRELSLDEAFMVPEIEGECLLNSESEHVPSPFKPFDLVLEFETDSEDLPAGADIPEGKSLGNCNSASSIGDMNGFSELGSASASQVFDKMSHPESTVDQSTSCAHEESSPCKMSVEGESRQLDARAEGVSLDLHSNDEVYEKQGENSTACKPELLKGMVASGPGSRWLFSGSRFAAFLRSYVGISEVSSIESVSKVDGRTPAREIGGRFECGCDSAPAKAQLSKAPAKRKVALSPCSQLKLLQSSNISSYKRMMPFCNELVKDLAGASEAPTMKNSPSSTDCMAPNEHVGHVMEVLSSESLATEHVKPEQNESQSESSLSHLEPLSTSYPNGLTIQNSLPGNSCISPDEYDVHAIEVLNDKAVSMKDVKPERNQSPLEPSSTHSETQTMKNPLPSVCYRAPKENDDHTVEVMSSESLPLERVDHENNETQLDQSLRWLDPSSTCHPEAQTIKDSSPSVYSIACKDNATHTVEVLTSESVSLGHLKSEQNGLWLEPPPSQLELSTACHPKAQITEDSLFNIACRALEYDIHNVEVSNSQSLPMQHVKSEQNGTLLESHQTQLEPFSGCHVEVQTTRNSLLTARSISAEGVKPKQNESHIEVSCGQLEPVPIQLKPPHPSCYLEDSSNTLERQVLMDPFSKDPLLMLPSSEGCSSPILMQKDLASDEYDMPLFGFKFPSTTSPGSADSTFFTPSEIPSPLDTPVSVPSKGILKASPRSCKGVCRCPDCASFRSQAEKASDFSLRQLQVMELLGMTLMNELINMRNLIEKSLVAVPHGVARHAVISYSEVKEASRSALKAEQTAKNYLMQMARDCNLHCKIMRMQQRSVKFADRIEVKLFKSE